MTSATLWRRGWRICAALVLLMLLAIVGATRVAAHAAVDRSDPAANSVLAQQPTEVRIWFTEPVEPQYTRAELYDSNGDRVETDPARVENSNELVLQMPPNLPNGTYTVQYRNISAADGHPQQGYLPFTIGTQSDVTAPAIPAPYNFSQPPIWLSAVARWLSLLGVTGAIGGLFAWLWVVRAACSPLDEQRKAFIQQRISKLILIWLGIGIGGSLLMLILQVWSTGDGFSPSVIGNVLARTRFGHLIALRVAMMVTLGLLTRSAMLWREATSNTTTALLVVLSALTLLPFSLISHASAVVIGRNAAIATDWLHLLASSIWIGGVITLVSALIYGTQGIRGETRRAVFALAIPRFTTIAITSVIILVVTGFYSSWLQVGNLFALRETSYGRVLIVKLMLIVPILALGALNQQVIGPRLRTHARSGARFGQAIAAEAMLGVGVLMAVALLTMLPTARETLTSRAERTTYHFDQGGAHTVLYISPGAAGTNQYIADVGLQTGPPPADMQVLLRFAKTGDARGIEGVREVELNRASGPRFEATGAELSVVGDWAVDLILREPGRDDIRFSRTIWIPKNPPSEVVPGQPPYFANLSAGFAVTFAGIAVVILVLTVRAAKTRVDRMTGTSVGLALLIAAGLIFALTRAAPTPTALATNPVPSDPESIAAGRELFLANCVSCHGSDARGDGPEAPTLKPQPADLTAAHVDAHTDGDIYWWIQNGINPSMPGTGDTLTEQQIWDLVNYVRSLRAELR